MMAGSAYPNYRQPKMRWLPAVPEHWNEQRAKTFFREVDERSKTGQEELLSVSHLTGVTPRSQKNVTMFKAVSYVGSKLCRPGDIVINTLWAWMAALGASKHVGIVSPAYGVYRPHHADSFNPAYLDYLLRTRAYVAEYTGRSTGIRSSRLRLYPNQFLDIALIQPPRTEQDQIVAYLRAQDAHIARFINAKRDLIKLLTEQKLRIIDHAVTRGFNAAAALKPSGIEWLGEVPENWDVLRIKNVATESDERTSSGTEQLLSLSRHHGLVPFASLSTRPPSAKDFMKYKVCKPGQLVMNRMQAWSGLFAESTSVGLISPDYSVFNIARRTSANFLSLLFKTRRYVSQFAIRSTGIGTGFNRLYTPQFGAIALALPPFGEQVEICRRITDACKPLDEAIRRTEEEIKLIREYRDRLIADVVTGQVDVRGWQPGPEDVMDDTALAALGDDSEDVTEEEDGDGED